MKFICTQENLNKGLMIVNHIANKNTTLPILNNVLLKAENGVLKLATTNLEIGIHSLVRGRVEKEGEFTVVAKLLSDYVNLLPNDQIILEVNDEGIVNKAYYPNTTPVRGFETMLKGKPADFAPIAVMRICGICQTTHGIASCEAVEDAIGCEIPEDGKVLGNSLGLETGCTPMHYTTY